MISDAVTADLVRRVQRGEPRAFEGLAKAYLRAAYSVALAIVRRPSDAEDVAQDALLIAFERIDTCREPARFGGWLMQITRNQSRNFLDRRRLRDVPAQEPNEFNIGSQAADDRGPERAKLLTALELLSEAQREVVLLHDLEGWTHAEIGRALELSEVMSRQHLFQARRVLRGALEEGAEGAPRRKAGGAQ
ncbi:MAG: sigma-70 family RNA polymerase sigma factor [Polyangiaceae bacterium]|nr:sigma-70 family RNA polymerase sigma factor [Myxococcales bacterium]MCB9588129.1 sigma-70 family RNA polymerase sigma factor [Polyangiaceae bacterium]